MSDVVKLRLLTAEELEKLTLEDSIFIKDEETGAHQAHLTKSGADFEGGFYRIKTVFGEIVQRSIDDGIYVQDDNGEPSEVAPSAGTYLKLALFCPGDDTELFDVIADALREKYGKGRIQIWEKAEHNVPDKLVDVHLLKTGRGRKANETLELAKGVYPTRVQHLKIPEGYDVELKPHVSLVDQTPTI